MYLYVHVHNLYICWYKCIDQGMFNMSYIRFVGDHGLTPSFQLHACRRLSIFVYYSGVVESKKSELFFCTHL